MFNRKPSAPIASGSGTVTKPKTRAIVRVLVASSQIEAHAALDAIAPYQAIEAVTTRGVYQALQNVQLAIIEFEQLIEEEVPYEMLVEILNRSRVPWTTPEGFLQDPASWRAHALAAAGDFKSFPPAIAAITSYSGGVGKTTLTLDSAIHFAARTHLPTAVVEFPHGPSPLRAITGVLDGAGFVDVLHQGQLQLPSWRGVTLVTVNYNDVGPILKPDEVAQRLEQIRKTHVLTLVDSEFPHPWLDIVAPQIETFLVIAAPRPDAFNNAAVLSQTMRQAPELYRNAQVIFNMVDGWSDRLTQLGLERAMDLPRIKEPERLDGRLGGLVLKAIYSYWSSSPGKNATMPAPRSSVGRSS